LAEEEESRVEELKKISANDREGGGLSTERSTTQSRSILFRQGEKCLMGGGRADKASKRRTGGRPKKVVFSLKVPARTGIREEGRRTEREGHQKSSALRGEPKGGCAAIPKNLMELQRVQDRKMILRGLGRVTKGGADQTSPRSRIASRGKRR